MILKKIFFIILLLSILKESLLVSIVNIDNSKSGDLTYKRIINKIPRTGLYYTQGLFFDTDYTVIESGGLYKESVLVRMEYPSMNIIKKINLEKKYFAEGITKCGNYIYQLTWHNRVVLKYSYPEIELISTVPLDRQINEGWGLTSDGKIMYATDGSNTIYFIDCETVKVIKKVSIYYNGIGLDNLNALVYVDGMIYSNRYYDNRIFKIKPLDGKVVEAYDMSHLIDLELKSKTLTNSRLESGDVLNGIAYNSFKKVFLVTGKKWGFYYEVNFDK